MNFSSCPDSVAAVDPYRIGFTVKTYNPAEESYRHMLRLVAYDIADSRRLRLVARACLDYGIRVEYSVFECDLSEELFNMLWTRLADLIDPEKDRILAYRICGSCVAAINSMGTVCRPGRPLLYIL